MTVAAPVRRAQSVRRPSPAARRVGYAIGAAVNVALLVAVNATPGWTAVPFLTAATTDVLPLVNASLAAGVVANLGYAVADPTWWRSLGELVTTAIGLAALIAIWRVFPFDFGGSAWPLHWASLDWGFLDWSHLARVVLVVAIGGSLIAIAVHAGKLATHVARACARP